MFWDFIILSLLHVAAQCNDLNAPISSVNGYRTVAYFVNWAIYGNFTPQELPAINLTHVLYAFADINPDTGEVFLSDTRADTEKPLSGDSSDGGGNNLHGCLEQLYLLKKLNRALKVLLSVGGWTYSSHFASPASASQGRSTFASSVVSLVKTYGLDGVDIDWDYPSDALQAADLISLLQEVRAALDGYGNLLDPPYHFTLTVACPGPYGYQYLNLSAINQTVDFLNVMAYDYTGPWSETSGNQANLFPSLSIPVSTPFNTEAIVSYILQSIRPDRIVLGVPLYGRAFNNTDGLGEQFSGSRTYDFKELPLSGQVEINDNETGSSYCYGNRELISYDSISMVRLKAAFIQNKTLGGVMFWESSMDGGGDKSIIKTMVGELDGKDSLGLDGTLNQLVYPDSPYDNILKSEPAFATTTSRLESTYMSSSKISSATGVSPSALPANASCTGGPPFYRYQNLEICACGLDISGKEVFYTVLGVCYNNNCSATLMCGENEACIPDGCASGPANCAQVIEGCQDSPLVTEIDFN